MLYEKMGRYSRSSPIRPSVESNHSTVSTSEYRLLILRTVAIVDPVSRFQRIGLDSMIVGYWVMGWLRLRYGPKTVIGVAR